MKRRYKQLLDKYYEEENEDKQYKLEQQLHKKYGSGKKCVKCGNQLLISDLKQYKYLCLECDENFYSIEIQES